MTQHFGKEFFTFIMFSLLKTGIIYLIFIENLNTYANSTQTQGRSGTTSEIFCVE